jgi:hypothetical protein
MAVSTLLSKGERTTEPSDLFVRARDVAGAAETAFLGAMEERRKVETENTEKKESLTMRIERENR